MIWCGNLRYGMVTYNMISVAITYDTVSVEVTYDSVSGMVTYMIW